MDTENTIIVRPKVIDDVLINPGMGFMTFQRFNGDALNEGLRWTEGHPIEYQEFSGSLENKDHPDTSIAYFRIYWRYLEPKRGEYCWDMLDKALAAARQRGQTLMLRVAPYGTDTPEDVPGWYREEVGPRENYSVKKWMVDPEDPRYAEYFGGFIRVLGRHYDGHPDLDSVDLAIVGAWGEGAGASELTQKTREALVDAYIDTFKETPLMMLLMDEATHKYGSSRANIGYRADCLGDIGGWRHMLDIYPQKIIRNGLKNAWIKAPISFEVCWVIQHWLDKGWDIDYIIDQSLKWHISSFNAKSSPVPEVWKPNVERWLKKMGYRLALRRFEYPAQISAGSELEFTSWWENLGVAPCYRRYPFALRIKNDKISSLLPTNADIREWLPGDSLFDGSVMLPSELVPGTYELQIGILDKLSMQPKVKLAIDGMQPDGWYRLGNVEVV
jgi:hypothetical protein